MYKLDALAQMAKEYQEKRSLEQQTRRIQNRLQQHQQRIIDNFGAMKGELVKRLVGNSVKGRSSMQSAIANRVARGRPEVILSSFYRMSPHPGLSYYTADTAAHVNAHLKKLYRKISKDVGSVVTPFNPKMVRLNKLLTDTADQSSDNTKKEGGSRVRPRSKSRSKMMKRKRTTLKRKSHK